MKMPVASNQSTRPPHPGISATADGSESVVWVETHISQGACAYPITPSTPMGTGYEVAFANGKTNLWDEPITFMELESEHSSASACEGFALAGGRVANFTSGQGLVLMKEVLFTISGKRLPAVFHIGARALTSHSLNVHAGHDDVMAVSDCGWGMLFAKNAQEACDLALIARRTAEKTQTPFMNVQDGFLTTHTIQDLKLPEPEFMKDYVGDPNNILVNLMDPYHPIQSGTVQNQDSYMKGKVAQRYFTDSIKEELKLAMDEFTVKTGRQYDLISSYKMEDAEWAIVGMGTMLESSEAVIDYLRETRNMKIGCVHVTAFRPFPSKEIVTALQHVKGFSVLERMDNPLAESNPLTMEIKASFADYSSHNKKDEIHIPKIYSGSAGLGSRDVRPSDLIAVVDNMLCDDKRTFTVGIKHPMVVETDVNPDIRLDGMYSMRGHSVGGYGSVTTNKIIATIVADLFDLHVQAYPKYGSEKKGLPTTYFMTAGNEPIRTHSELEFVEFVALNDVNAFNLSNPLIGLTKGGALFIQTHLTDPDQIQASIPKWAKKIIQDQNIKVYALDTKEISRQVSTRPDLVQRMQGIVLLGVFLRVTPFADRFNLDKSMLMEGVEKSINKYFGKKGEQVVQDNLKAVSLGFDRVIKVSEPTLEGEIA